MIININPIGNNSPDVDITEYGELENDYDLGL